MKEKNNVLEKERRFLPEPVTIEIEERDGKEIRRVSGYAAVFDKLSNRLGWFREKIDRGAFDEVLTDDVVALFNHDINKVLARTISNTLALSVDDHGLRYEFEAPNSTAGNDLVEMLRRGDVQHSSFAFSIDKENWDEDPDEGEIRTVIKVKRLYDVSPVVFPAYSETDVSLAKRSYDDWKKNQELPFDDIGIYEQEIDLLKAKL